ncbi:rRNA maturation RNase YbeY [Sandaracinobacteroides saxicola]|uniref:Endoribonuclease YbeY n=1 Tax=Sandaracinobacteroides saxicola TaxID=2759707 RepID=A0A7G5ILZ2_9SPHN|nr:rRNA maturation RNase YbeY [Sandaracinobacteroides saxicola]QMW24384.1 rRNA maturation RNase YbeY [Sandaracinobacteroides saxicola]
MPDRDSPDPDPLQIDTGVGAGDWGAEDWDGLARRAIRAALAGAGHAVRGPTEIAVRLSDDAELRALNAAWRGKDRPTNILSFPMEAEAAAPGAPIMLGDLVLAHETCVAEAVAKAIPLTDHVSHLLVHGTLHLLGHDHLTDAEAEAMEALETAILATLHIANPYALESPDV